MNANSCCDVHESTEPLLAIIAHVIIAGPHDEEQAAISAAFASLRPRRHNCTGSGDRGDDPFDRQTRILGVHNGRRAWHLSVGLALRFVIAREFQRHVDQR